MLLVVIEAEAELAELSLVVTCIIGRRAIEEGPTIVALACARAFWKAPIIPDTFSFVEFDEGTIVMVGYGS